jgi:hypothetical protein
MKDETKHRSQPEYGRGGPRNGADLLDLSAPSPGQKCPGQCPYPDESEIEGLSECLGAPLSTRDVARVIGCSVWTVRHRYLAAGLPHVRIGRAGKLIFYTNQVVGWLLRQQQKGGVIL